MVSRAFLLRRYLNDLRQIPLSQLLYTSSTHKSLNHTFTIILYQFNSCTPVQQTSHQTRSHCCSIKDGPPVCQRTITRFGSCLYSVRLSTHNNTCFGTYLYSVRLSTHNNTCFGTYLYSVRLSTHYNACFGTYLYSVRLSTHTNACFGTYLYSVRQLHLPVVFIFPRYSPQEHRLSL